MTLDVSTLPKKIRTRLPRQRVLITGGLGFIGSNLAHALVAAGAKVTILDALLPQYGGNHINLAGIQDKVELVNGDIRDEKLMNKLVKKKDYIFHLAGQVSYLDSGEQPFTDLEFNGRANLILLEAIKKHAPKARVLFSSSRLVYGKILTLPVKEDHPTDPLSMYGIHKLLGEKYYRYYAANFDINSTSVRIPNPYGPRQQMKHAKYSIVGWFLRLAMEDKDLTVYGDGTQERDYIYIDDIVDGLIRINVQGKPGEVYNVGSKERIRFVDMVDTIIDVVGSGKKVHVPWPKEYEANETGDYIADTAKVEKQVKWHPSVRFADGIKEMAEYYKANKQHYW